MSIISIPFSFSPGGTIVSSQVNSCFSTIYNDYNGSIGNSNLSSSIVIADSKLAQLTSASKVNGTALTNFTGIPSGAGVIPTANLPSQYASSIILGLVSSGTQAMSSGWNLRTTWTTVKDSGGYWASNVYTPLVAGYYLVNYYDNFQPVSAGTQCYLSIYKSGAQYYTTQMYNPTSTTPMAMSVSGIVQCNGSTDTISFYLNQGGGSGNASYGGAGYSGVSIVRVF